MKTAGGEAPADRLHNREDPSASEMAEILREVQDTLAAVEARLGGLEDSRVDASLTTRHLARSVADMGETLARRLRSLEGREMAPASAAAPGTSVPAFSRSSGARRTPENVRGLAIAVFVVLALVLAGFWFLDRAAWRHASNPPLASPARARPAVVPAPPPRPAGGSVASQGRPAHRVNAPVAQNGGEGGADQ